MVTPKETCLLLKQGWSGDTDGLPRMQNRRCCPSSSWQPRMLHGRRCFQARGGCVWFDLTFLMFLLGFWFTNNKEHFQILWHVGAYLYIQSYNHIPYTVYLLSCLYLIYLQSQHNVLIHAVFFSHIDKITFKHSNFSAGGCPDQISQEEVSAISPEHGRAFVEPVGEAMSMGPACLHCVNHTETYQWIVPTSCTSVKYMRILTCTYIYIYYTPCVWAYLFAWY